MASKFLKTILESLNKIKLTGLSSLEKLSKKVTASYDCDDEDEEDAKVAKSESTEKKAPPPLIGVGRMKYPYTFTAKVAQFPYRFYYDNCWIFKYYIFAIFVSLPIFMKLEWMSYSKNNVAYFKERKKELFTPHTF